MKTLHRFGMVAAAALAITACAKKPPADIPPPVGTDGTGTTTDGGISGAVIPGSQQDFVAKVTSDRIFFDTDQYDVDASDRAILDSQVAWLRQYPNVRVTIEGHADERGTREYNLALGERRANAAKNYLASAGIDPSRITTISYGKERPDALGSDPASWAKNRRAVTVTVQ